VYEAHAKRGRLGFRDTTEGPYRTLEAPIGFLVCGDFNLGPDDPEHAQMRRPFQSGVPSFVDAWTARHGAIPHPPTTGVADLKQWPQGPHCRDYFFVSENMADRIEDVRVDVDTTASDHQPLTIALDL
jgi:endonuclease/exonuclease/phosphatase family metal-dependent hydrolase